MLYKIGDVVDYKLRGGRGRPSAGTVIEQRGDKVLIETNRGKRVEILITTIRGPHVARYTPRQRRLL